MDKVAEDIAISIEKDNIDKLAVCMCKALMVYANANLLYCPNCNDETRPCGFGRDLARALSKQGVLSPEQMKVFVKGLQRQLLTDFVLDLQENYEHVLLDDEPYVSLWDINQLRKEYLNEGSSN
jgi:hypothetical protein